jgi:hypothetical protein
LETILGKENHLIVEGIHSKLRSAGQRQEPEAQRKTSRFISVVASSNDEQEKQLLEDNQVTLKWDVAEDYVGRAAANTVRNSLVAIH